MSVFWTDKSEASRILWKVLEVVQTSCLTLFNVREPFVTFRNVSLCLFLCMSSAAIINCMKAAGSLGGDLNLVRLASRNEQALPASLAQAVAEEAVGCFVGRFLSAPVGLAEYSPVSPRILVGMHLQDDSMLSPCLFLGRGCGDAL